MRLSFGVLYSALVACLLSAVLVSAADPIIVQDSVSGNVFSLPTGYPGTLYDAQYDTALYAYQNFTNTPRTALLPGSAAMNTPYILINVTWAGDEVDSYSLVVPAGLSVMPLPGSNSNCFNSTQASLTADKPLCVYNLTWPAPFSGTFSIVYSNSSNPVGSETIDLTFIDSETPVTPQPQATGDPQFVGLRGQNYQVHGIDGAVYNLITESNTQVNSRFVFLTEGECPIIDGVAAPACWSHPGSYMGDMSFQTVVDGKLHAALVTAGDAKKGFSNVQVDGKALKVGDIVSFGTFSVSYDASHSVYVTLDNYNIQLSNSDMFVNLALTAKVPLSQLKSHGLIGQTHSTKTYKTAIKYIQGEVDDYSIADNDVFGTQFPYNKFEQ